MLIQQIRSAAIKITYGGVTFLIDPWLADKESNGCFRDYGFELEDESKLDIKMPRQELPLPREEILKGCDAYLITHLHPDHIDMGMDGKIALWYDRNLSTFVQSAEDKAVLEANGFTKVIVLREEGVKMGDVTLYKTPGLHGTIVPCGPSCGVVFKTEGEKKLYLAGDTIWFEGVAKTISQYMPDVIITNNCSAHFVDCGRLIMDTDDLKQVHEAAPGAIVIASHMDNVPHAQLTRATLKEELKDLGLLEEILIPEDGEILEF